MMMRMMCCANSFHRWYGLFLVFFFCAAATVLWVTFGEVDSPDCLVCDGEGRWWWWGWWVYWCVATGFHSAALDVNKKNETVTRKASLEVSRTASPSQSRLNVKWLVRASVAFIRHVPKYNHLMVDVKG